jgi:hypothetical protein
VEKGDTAIDLVGFSRGAATCLDFCNLVEDWQIKDPKKLGPTWDLVSYLTAPRVGAAPPFRFIGLFDVVGAFGLAAIAGDLPEFNLGHRLRLPKTRVNYCFHAMALDETRTSFNVIRVKGAHEVWFRGAHSDIGGGNRIQGLNDIALRWMLRKAVAAGLPIDSKVADNLKCDYNIQPGVLDLPPIWRPLAKTDLLHYTVRTFANTRPLFVESPTEFPPDEAKAQPVGAAGVAADAVAAATA